MGEVKISQDLSPQTCCETCNSTTDRLLKTTVPKHGLGHARCIMKGGLAWEELQGSHACCHMCMATKPQFSDSPLPPTCPHTSVNTSQGFEQKPMSLQQAVFVAGSGRNLKARFHESWHHLSDSKKESFFYALNSIRVELSIQMCLYQLQSHAVLLGILVTLPAITNRAV